MDGAERVYRIVLFGATGSGKSSIINLLADEQVADVSAGVEPCTKRARWYPISLGEKKFRLWDTMGFNSVGIKDINPLSSYEQALYLLRNLPKGVDLILLCARIDRINASVRKLYWLLDSFFFGGQAHIALVVTHLDTLPEQHRLTWWDRSGNSIIQRCNVPVQSLPCACITTVHDESSEFDPLYQQSKQTMKALLETVGAIPPISLPLDLLFGDAAAETLSIHCRLSIGNATALVEKFRLPQRRFNVVLFGEAGAGKSSVVNLLAGRQVAGVSDKMYSCTLDFSEHEIDAGSCELQIWDTVGLNGRHSTGDDMSWKAMENAAGLIRSLHNQGGVDLLIFCKKSGRPTCSEVDCFTLFYEFLCERQIPVSFIITHLEFVNPMEKWWDENGRGFIEACGLKSSAIAGHACITSRLLVDPDDQNLCNKLSLSRRSVQTMLEDAIEYCHTSNKAEGGGVMSTLKKLARTVVQVGNLRGGGRTTVKNLMERFGLSREHAEELIRLSNALG